MAKIYVTGDTHIPIDIRKLNTIFFPEGNTLTENDYLIVAGDFGLIWNRDEWTNEELYWKKWLEDKPWTTLFVDGNHENFDRLNAFPVSEWNGGKVHLISERIIHLMRGQVYNIDGTTIFTFGGAKSTDRGPATGTSAIDSGIIWWKEEMPTIEEMDEGCANLEACGWNVDYIITHDLPLRELVGLSMKTRIMYKGNYINGYLDDIRINTKYKHWYAGHYHEDVTLSEKQTELYNRIIPLGETLI